MCTNIYIYNVYAHLKYTQISYLVPQPIVTVTAPDIQLEGRSLTLQCDVTTVRGITSTVDIVWSIDDEVQLRERDVSSTTVDNSLVYSHSYTISPLTSMDVNGRVQCEAVINAPDEITASEFVTLNVISKLTCCVLYLHNYTYYNSI